MYVCVFGDGFPDKFKNHGIFYRICLAFEIGYSVFGGVVEARDK